MIRADIVGDFNKFDELVAFSRQFPEGIKRKAAAAFNQRIRLGLLSQLRKTPKRRFWGKADFVNDASRRAFFAKTGGKAYQRTGRLAAGWSTAVTTSDSAVAFSISNKVPYEKWVSGNKQVFGHAKTGWPLHAETFNAWKPRVVQVMDDAIHQYVKENLP